jgi:predicted phosphodiesterase
MYTALILPDIHYPYHDKQCLKIVEQVAKDLSPEYLVYLGDNFNADGISKYTHKEMERGIYETADEIDGFKKDIHEPLSQYANRILWCGGNHDTQRISDLLQKLREKGEEPRLIKHYEDTLSLKSRFPDVKICEYNESHKIGKLHLTHGVYHNDAHAKKHAMAFGASVVYGHLHTFQSYTTTSRGTGQSHKATCIGCLCDLNPGYMKNRPSGWAHGFAVAYFQDNGNFNLYPIEIIKGQCIFNGKLYS